jgi:hypothetical protein
MHISTFNQLTNDSIKRSQGGARALLAVLTLLLLPLALAMPAAARQVTQVVLAGGDGAEGLTALWFLPDGDDFVFGTGSAVDMSIVAFGDGSDLFICNASTAADGTQCSPTIFLDSASKGLRGEVIDAFAVGKSGVVGNIGECHTMVLPLVGK